MPLMVCIRRAGELTGTLFFALVLLGCASLPAPPSATSVQLAHVPAYAQQDLQCGPAALASVLNASGVAVTPESLTPDLFIPARKGSLQVELAAQARQRERVPVQLEASEAALIEALQQGQPALVLLNLGVRSYPIWHYAVVTGFDPARGYTLNAGKAQAEIQTRGRFLRRWNWADRWALTLHSVDEPPSGISAAQWLAAAAPIQRSHPASAERAYLAASRRWPDAALAWAALGEARYQAGEPAAAVQHLRRATQLAPSDAAIANNLASALLALGCVHAAAEVLDAIEPGPAPAAVAEALRLTRQELIAAGPDRCVD